MEEGAADASTPAAIAADRLPLGIRKFGQRFVVSCGQDRRIVKLVPANDAAGCADRIGREQTRLAVSQMQLASGEAGRMTEQAGHGMAHAIRVLDPFAKHHVAPAIAVHRPALGEVREPAAEALRRRAAERWDGPLDLEHLAEEVEDLGTSQLSTVRSQM